MPTPSKSSDLFKLAGIEDVAKFYRDRFFTGGVFDARYFDPISRFDIKYARTMWVYDNVRHGASLLDLGCGEGLLALLKRKGVTLTGVDLSAEFLQLARRNGYDATYVAQLTSLPFADASFDYVASLDLFGHLAFEEKDAVISEIRRVLRPDGVTMHGIEVLDRTLHPDYDAMSEEELLKFISIDGHIGLEDEEENAARFRKFFANVQIEPRYALSISCDEFIKQSDQYGMPFDADFIDYLRNLSFNERRAFDMAMGYVFGKVSDLHLKLPKNGLYVLLKANSCEPEPFYNAHRNRRDLFVVDVESNGPIYVDRFSRATFDNGWYPANDLPPIARWMSKRAAIQLEAETVSKVRLDLTTHIPDLAAKPLGLEFLLNGVQLCSLSLFRYGWLELEVDVPEFIEQSGSHQKLNFEIRADRTWQPVHTGGANTDDRELSIAVCNIEFLQ